MKSAPLPLLDFFFKLQERNYPLGIQEYLAFQQALAAGFGVNSRLELIFLCRTLWAKSPEEAAQIEDLLEIFLPPKPTAAQLNEFIDSLDEVFRQEAAARAPNPIESIDRPDSPISETADSGQANADAPTPQPVYQPKAAILLNNHPEAAEFNIPMPAIRELPAVVNWDFTGRMPVTNRQMKRAWRYYRRMQRVGSPIELDVPATIKRIYQQGVLLEPVLVPRRSNMARMLILADAGGSMLPFGRMVEALTDSAAHSGLAKVAAFYFHDVAQKIVYRDAGRTIPAEFEDVLAEFSNAGILIVSDAGAARGGYDERRIEQTGEMVKAMRHFTPNMAWLNPAPKIRWAGTTAEAIIRRHQVPMFAFDRPGLDAAVEVLRGRSAKYKN